MKRLGVLAAVGALAWAAACSSSDGGGAPGTDGGAPGQDGGSSSGTNPPPPYAGGDVTVSIVKDTDAGAADAGDAGASSDLVTGKVTIHMEPANPTAIATIDALVDGNVVGTATQAPYDVAWDSASVSNGAHLLSARPHDLGGQTGTGPLVPITTSNFLFAGTWKWSSVTDSSPGFGADPCQDATFTVTFDPATSTMTLPQFYLKCTAQNQATYSSNIHGFSMVLTPDKYAGPIVNKTGTVTTTFTGTKLTQSDSFNGNTQSGTLTKM